MRRPAWLRNHLSCPSCGLVVDKDGPKPDGFDRDDNFDCPRCKEHFSAEDFYEEHCDKLAHIEINRELNEKEDKRIWKSRTKDKT